MASGGSIILPLSKGDSLVVDMSQEAVKTGQTDPYEIEKYLNKGIAVYTVSNLHAKVYVFDNKLIVGSANVSQNSQRNLVEAGLLCEAKDVVTQARGWIKTIQREHVTPEYVQLCKKLYNPPKIRQGAVARRDKTVTPSYSRLWLAGTIHADLCEEEEQISDDTEQILSKKLKDKSKFEVESIRLVRNSYHCQERQGGRPDRQCAQ